MKQIFAILVLALLLLGCASQNVEKQGNLNNQTNNQSTQEVVDLKTEPGDSVEVDYLGTLENGTVFDTSIQEEAVKAKLPSRPAYSPLGFKVGAGQMIAGFDKAVVGMKVGEEKTVTLKPEEAYGEIQQNLIVDIPKDKVPPEVQKGSRLMASNGMSGVVLEVGNETVKIDFNHELAGKSLTFKIIMRKITKASN